MTGLGKRGWIGFSVVMLSVQAWAFSGKKAETVWVQKPDGSKQCEPGGGSGAVSIEQARAALAEAGVGVVESKKGSDGKMRAQLCGSPTGQMNLFLIEAEGLAKAKALGFEPKP